ncbi:MAG: SDR family oxidoreductase [Alphaproteobacteria bacterium]
MSGLPKVDSEAAIELAVDADLLDRFAAYSGDRNPMHFDDDFARRHGLPGRVAHGMAYAAHISTLIGMHLPGPGALWAYLTLRFLKPAHVGDRVTLSARVIRVSDRRREVVLDLAARNQHGEALLSGEAGTLLPLGGAESATDDRGRAERPVMPEGAAGTALVFGASGALGGAIARRLGADGFAVGLLGRRLDALQRCADELGPAAAPLACDLTDAGSVSDAVDRARAAFGPIRAVVHCASAPLAAQPVDEIGAAAVDAHFRVQVHGLVNILRACAPALREAGGGTVTYLGSTAAHGAPPPGLAAYAAAKAAGAALVRSVAAELAPAGVRGNIVSPSFLATELTAHVPERARKLAAAQTPMRRLAERDEVAAAVAFVAGAAGSYVNGHDLVVDGGQVMA